MDRTATPPFRRGAASSRRSALSVAAVLVALGAPSCGASRSSATNGSGSGGRPTTPATLGILQPAPNEVSGPTVHLVVRLTGAVVVQAAAGPVHPGEGHIHVSLDGQLVSMAYGTTQDLPNLTPGPHSIRAEFVAIDHLPFANRVTADVLFSVKS